MYDSILIPLDGSLYAESALRHVACHEPDARKMTLVRVINTVEELIGVAQPDPLDTMEKTEEMLAKEAHDAQYGEASHYLAQLKGLASYEGLHLQTVVVEGPSAEQLLTVASQVNADLIVITSHGLSASGSPTKTGVFGKVADGILRRAEAPVLVIKPFHPRSY
jgi:nucleotide-binding universal stress UspA family protein